MLDAAVPILVGFVIGWITNWLAIVMLFRPYRPTRIVPGLTIQGVFPKCQGEFAAAAGRLVADEFFRADVLRRHFEHPDSKQAVAVALQPLVPTILDTPLGTAEQAAARWQWPLDSLVESLADRVAASVVDQWQYPPNRRALQDLLARALEGVLQRPLSHWVERSAPAFSVSAWLKRLVESDVVGAIADHVAAAAKEKLQHTDELADWLPEDGAAVVRSWFEALVPALQDLLATQVDGGSLGQVLKRELFEAVREGVQRRLPPETWLGRVISGDRVAGWVESLSEGLPSVLAKALRSDAGRRTLTDLARGLAAEMLKTPPARVAGFISATLAQDLRRWTAEGIRGAMTEPAVEQRVLGLLQAPVQAWLDRPVAEWLAGVTGNTADDLSHALARLILDAVEPASVAEPIRAAVRQKVGEAARHDLGTLRQVLTKLVGAPTAAVAVDHTFTRVADWAASRAADAVSALDIAQLVRENIEAWPPNKLEAAVHEVARTHLQFVTWVGGLLGALIGAAQLLLR